MIAICLYKKLGESSFKALSKIKKKYNTVKVGHGGTLDPLAEGVLAVAVGEATKLLPYFDLDPKTYVVEIIFGHETLTLDAEGQDVESILDRLNKINFKFDQKDVEKVLNDFLGEIEQVPPLFSAIKIDGERAYDLARKNVDDKVRFNDIESKIKSRKVNLYDFKILSFELPKMSIEISCSGGFYVRSLVRDLAIELNEKAFMSKLFRSKVGKFEFLDTELNFDNYSENDFLYKELPIGSVLKDYKRIDINNEQYVDLRNGKIINLNGSIELVDDLICDSIYYVYYLENLVSVVKAISNSEIKVIKNINI